MTDASIFVLTGVEEHSDPWHALDATSEAVGSVLTTEGVIHSTSTSSPAPWPAADLLVVNASGDLALSAPDSARVVDAILEHHQSGRPLIALHSSALAFRDDARWSGILGGRWVPGVTMHPQIGHALVQPTPRAALPEYAVSFDGDFVLYDERYTLLERAEDTVVIAEHSEDGVRHPLVWWRGASPGQGAVVYSALGHGVESFESDTHRDWLRATARRLLDEVAGQRGNAE
jgi:type 1 glutamine amidotransferase